MNEPTEQELISKAFSALGRRRSARKAASSRSNGRKGGRPKGIPASAETKAKISATKRQRSDRSAAA